MQTKFNVGDKVWVGNIFDPPSLFVVIKGPYEVFSITVHTNEIIYSLGSVKDELNVEEKCVFHSLKDAAEYMQTSLSRSVLLDNY